MTNQGYPITPPPKLLQRWFDYDPFEAFTIAARWGADQELEACCEWLVVDDWKNVSENLRAARRPKPPSLKERALQAWAAVETGTDDQTATARMTDFRALCAELVDDLELCDWPYKLKDTIRADIERALAALAKQPVGPPTSELEDVS